MERHGEEGYKPTGPNSDIIRGSIDTIILKCLHHDDMYGLEICNFIKKASSDTYVLKQPTLYSALKRLEGKKLISSYWRDSAIGGRRHYYALTDEGRKSLVGRKDQWSASKEVIDSLVDGQKKPTKKPVLPIEDSDKAQPVAIPHTVTMGTPITPYNPYIASDDDMLTLPFRIIENSGAQGISANDHLVEIPFEQPNQPVRVQGTQQDDVPPLLKFVMADGVLSPTNEDEIILAPVKPQQENTFARYISPDDYAAVATAKTGAAAKTAKLASYDIKIRPFTRHYNDKKRGDFHYVGKLRLASACLMALILAAGLVVAYYNIKPECDYTSDERFFFILGAIAAVLYFTYYFVRFVSNPQSKKAVHSPGTEQLVRFGACLGVIIAILAINVLAGLTHVNSPDFLVFWTVPCIIAATIYIEGILQLFLRKTNLFVA